MPNYCDNVVVIKHKDEQLLESLLQASVENKFCEKVIPLPQELKETKSPNRDSEERKAELHLKYGADNWYDFCINNWGTKWDIFDVSSYIEDDELTIQFTTAWSPPLGVYKKLMEDGFEIEAKYYESGLGFAGVMTNDHNEHYDDLQFIPEDIRQEFGIFEEEEDEE